MLWGHVRRKSDRRQGMAISTKLRHNLDVLREWMSHPENKDVVIRELFIKSVNARGAVVYLDGMVNEQSVNESINRPLLQEDGPLGPGDVVDELMTKVLAIRDVRKVTTMEAAVKEVLYGNTVVVVDGLGAAISCATIGFQHRPVGQPQNEAVLLGPQEAFVESSQINRALIRKQLKDKGLVSESVSVGSRTPDDVFILYVKDIVNAGLLAAVKQRISQIQVDHLHSLAVLDQHLEERPYSLVPSILYTERPDRAVAFLQEGHIVLLMENSPACLVCPVTFWSFFHTAEEQYQRWAYANFTRLLRVLAIIVAVLTPSVYIAVMNYHREIIPVDLVLAAAAAREELPFPLIMELIIMEAGFELIREAGVRIPSPIGPTIGIVGALVLGQAAVEANVVSPTLIIIVALAGLAGFAIPSIPLSNMLRLGRFGFTIAGGFLGLAGIGLLLGAALGYLFSLTSFGVPFMAPMAPHQPSSGDLILRRPVWQQWLRPYHVQPQRNVRQTKAKQGRRHAKAD